MRRYQPELFKALLTLSKGRLVYLGYYGYGATKAWRYQGFKEGTVFALEKLKEGKDLKELEYATLENLVFEGTIFATYDSLVQHANGGKGIENWGDLQPDRDLK